MDSPHNRWNPAQVKFAGRANNCTRFSSASVRYITCNAEVSRSSAQDCVKLLVEEGSIANADPNCYFEKCLAFFCDAEGKLFVLLQWLTRSRQEARGFDIISNGPSFQLAPDVETKSYSTLPVSSIGALMVPGGDRYWALLSPREHRQYAMYFPRIA